MNRETVAILGASNKPDRYAYKALLMLKEYGHIVIPVNPVLDTIDSEPVIHTISEINTPISTVTLYLRPERYMPFMQDIINLKPLRVIFNPGTEFAEAAKMLEDENIIGVNACTLVLLRTGQF